ncbi:MAG: cell division protein FtsZ [Kiloniellales bacterium]
MALKLNVPKIESNLAPKITVIGVGGAGGNAVNNMIQSNVEGVEFLIANTDAQAIQMSLCERSLQLGRSITQGLGSGSRPEVGRAAAEEAINDILTELEGANMVFITAGMGGGTGTGGAPVIARAARESGILTVGVVTKPFHFEGVHRMRMAEAGITELTQYVDTLIVIPNQNLFRVANEKTTFADAFRMADDVLRSGVRGVTDLMVMPGLINLDFADIRSVMTEMGKAMMGTGEADGESRALAAAEAAISNPLLDEVSMKGARGLLINITGGPDLTLFEVDEAANRIRDEVDPEANIIFGSTFDQALEGRMRVSVVATGIESEVAEQPRPVALSLVSSQGGGGSDSQDSPKGSAAAMAQSAVPAMAQAFEPAVAPASAPTMTASAEEAPVMAQATGTHSHYAYTRMGANVLPKPAPAVADAAQPAPAAGTVAAPAQAVAVQTEASFIAPPPVAPEPEPEPAPESASRADPFAAAAIANASSPSRGSGPAAAAARKKGGLFAKVTGSAARALQAAAQSGDQRERSLAGPAAASRRSGESQALPAAQPRLTGLDATKVSTPGQSEEELLEIPAFLRRQAN